MRFSHEQGQEWQRRPYPSSPSSVHSPLLAVLGLMDGVTVGMVVGATVSATGLGIAVGAGIGWVVGATVGLALDTAACRSGDDATPA